MPNDSKTDDALEQKIHHLENEVARLSAENDRLRNDDGARCVLCKNIAALMTWIVKRWWGTNLVDCGHTLTKRLEAWGQGDANPPLREGIDFAAAAIVRFTRIGMFRGALASIVGIGAVVLAIGQILILDSQNAIVKEHKRIAATDKYVYFMVEEETARRLLGTAFDHWYPMSKLDLEVDSTFVTESVRKGVLAAIPSKSSVDEIVAKCGLSLYPVGNPREYGELALADLENGKVGSARFHAWELRNWMKKAADNCKKRVDLMKHLREEMRMHSEVVPVQDEVER